jgi:hypothetical protein
MSKSDSQTRAFLQILNKPANRKLAGFLRIRAGLLSRGLENEPIDLTKHDLHRICQNMAVYRARLLLKYPELYDTFISQDEASVAFWTELFIFGFPSDKARDNFNISGCEIFTLPEGLSEKDTVLPRGIYIRFGTNNSIKNLKDFIAKNSKNILKLQEQTFGKKKLPNLKPKKNELRDKVIASMFFSPITLVKKQAIEFGFEKNLSEIYKFSAIEAKEKIIVLIIQKLFKNKLSNGTIRSIAEANKYLLSKGVSV